MPLTTLVLRAKPIEALRDVRLRTGKVLDLHEYKEIVDRVGDRLGVRKRVPCKECDGRGSTAEWKERQK